MVNKARVRCFGAGADALLIATDTTSCFLKQDRALGLLVEPVVRAGNPARESETCCQEAIPVETLFPSSLRFSISTVCALVRPGGEPGAR